MSKGGAPGLLIHPFLLFTLGLCQRAGGNGFFLAKPIWEERNAGVGKGALKTIPLGTLTPEPPVLLAPGSLTCAPKEASLPS